MKSTNVTHSTKRSHFTIMEAYLTLLAPAAMAGAATAALDAIVAQTPLSPWNWTKVGYIVMGSEAAATAYLLNAFAGFDLNILVYGALTGILADAVVGPALAKWDALHDNNPLYMGLNILISGIIAFMVSPYIPIRI